MADRNTSRPRVPRRRRASELPTMVESADGWYGFGLRGIGWVEVALAKVDGSPEIVGLRIDVRPMFVDESERYVLDRPAEHYRQVAEVYKSAVEHRKPPLKAIQEHWHVSRPAAAKYVKGARERGFLGWPERAGH